MPLTANLAARGLSSTPTVASLHSTAASFMYMNSTQCMQEYLNPLHATRELVVVTPYYLAASQTHTVLSGKELTFSPRMQDAGNSSLLGGQIAGWSSVDWDLASFWICEYYDLTKGPDVPWRKSRSRLCYQTLQWLYNS
jgi:hypothetical protein